MAGALITAVVSMHCQLKGGLLNLSIEHCLPAHMSITFLHADAVVPREPAGSGAALSCTHGKCTGFFRTQSICRNRWISGAARLHQPSASVTPSLLRLLPVGHVAIGGQ